MSNRTSNTYSEIKSEINGELQRESKFDRKSPTHSYSNRFENKDWAYRNNKGGHIRTFQLTEDEAFFKNHLDQMAKKQTFDFSTLKNVEFKITFQGKDIIEKMEMANYEDLHDLDSRLKSNLKKMQFSQMTPIQRAVIPQLSGGYDVMGCSSTGSGKTAAFLIPIINKMLKEGPPMNEENRYTARPVTLILIPTRELADQIFIEARKICHKTGISIVKVYGAVGKEGQQRELKYGCDILIATPGRLLDFLRARDISLGAVKYLIIDEADRLMDMGFEPQLNSIVYDHDLIEKSKRQNLMFSATFEPEIKEIARKFMNDFYFIQNNSEMRTNSNVKQMVIYAKETEKILKLHQILQQVKGSIIIFLDTKKGVDNLNSFLERSNYNVIAIHGDKKQWQRQEAIKRFTTGEVPILIATDVASRGLDFPKVSYVFNFDMPSNMDDYVHRIGRTGRCGEKGVSVSFVNENNKNIVRGLYKILKEQNQEIPEFLQSMYSNLSSMPSTNHMGYRSTGNNYLNRRRDDDGPSRQTHQSYISNSNQTSWGNSTVSAWGGVEKANISSDQHLLGNSTTGHGGVEKANISSDKNLMGNNTTSGWGGVEKANISAMTSNPLVNAPIQDITNLNSSTFPQNISGFSKFNQGEVIYQQQQQKELQHQIKFQSILSSTDQVPSNFNFSAANQPSHIINQYQHQHYNRKVYNPEHKHNPNNLSSNEPSSYKYNEWGKESRDKYRDRERSREKERSRDKERDRERSRNKERSRDRDKDYSSRSEKSRDSNYRDKDYSSRSEKSRDSNYRDKDYSSRRHDKEHSNRRDERVRSRDRSKEKDYKNYGMNKQSSWRSDENLYSMNNSIKRRYDD